MGTRTSRILHRSLRETPPKAIGGEGVWLIAENGHRDGDRSEGDRVTADTAKRDAHGPSVLTVQRFWVFTA